MPNATTRLKVDASATRAVNVLHCAISLRDGNVGTVAGIARATGLSRPTVESALNTLVEQGLATEDAESHQGVAAGRPARGYSFNGDAGYVSGVDIGTQNIRVALADARGRVVGWQEEDVPVEADASQRISSVKRAVSRCLEDCAIPLKKLLSMGVAVTGLVGTDGRLVESRNLPDLEGVDIAGNLRSAFDCDVTVDNDIRLAALAEHRLGAARLADDVVYIWIGRRMSVGLILGGNVRRGRHIAAGEIGDFAFGPYLNARGEIVWTSAATGKEVIEGAANGDRQCLAEVDAFAEKISTGVATIALTIDPDVVIIGGGLSRAGETLLKPLRHAVHSMITVPVKPQIVASKLGSESVVLGAVAQAYEPMSRVLFGIPGAPDPAITSDPSLSHLRWPAA